MAAVDAPSMSDTALTRDELHAVEIAWTAQYRADHTLVLDVTPCQRGDGTSTGVKLLASQQKIVCPIVSPSRHREITFMLKLAVIVPRLARQWLSHLSLGAELWLTYEGQTYSSRIQVLQRTDQAQVTSTFRRGSVLDLHTLYIEGLQAS